MAKVSKQSASNHSSCDCVQAAGRTADWWWFLSNRIGFIFSKIGDRLKTHARLRQVLEMASCNADAAAPSSDVGNGVKELLGYIWVYNGI